MAYEEIREALGFDPYDHGAWPADMLAAYQVLPENDDALNWCGAIAWERQRRAQEAEQAAAALVRHDSGTPREVHPVIGVMG